MLTKSERRFVHDPHAVSRKYRTVLKSRINKKIQRCGADLKMILEKNSELQLNVALLAELFSTAEPLQKSVVSKKKLQDDQKEKKISILDMNKMT